MLSTGVIIAILEMHFVPLSLMWHGVVRKTRKRLVDLLDKNNENLENLLADTRKQL